VNRFCGEGFHGSLTLARLSVSFLCLKGNLFSMSNSAVPCGQYSEASLNDESVVTILSSSPLVVVSTRHRAFAASAGTIGRSWRFSFN
jgi:hypothetical protein